MHFHRHSLVNWLSAIVFLIAAVIQSLRVARGLTVIVGDMEVPMAASIAMAIVFAGLAYWNFHEARCCKHYDHNQG